MVADAPDSMTGLCLDCNYPLHGLESLRCPECGRAFDAGDDRTFNPGRPMSRWSRWWLKRTGWWVNLLSLTAAGLLIASHREWGPRTLFSYGTYSGADVWVPNWLGVYHQWFYFEGLAVWTWVALLVMWIVFAAGRWIVVKTHLQPRWQLRVDRPRRRFASWVFLIGSVVAGFNLFSCPHATYLDWWGWGGVAYHRPCSYKAPARLHIAGEIYAYLRG